MRQTSLFPSDHIDFVARLENIEEDFDIICKNLVIPNILEKKNKSKRNKYQTYYTDSIIEKVGELYKTDIELGKYKYD